MKRSHETDDNNDDSSYDQRNDNDEDDEGDDEAAPPVPLGDDENRPPASRDAACIGISGADSTSATDSTHPGVTEVTMTVRTMTSPSKSKASIQWALRQERRRESNRLSKRRCRGQKRELISSYQLEVHRLSEEFKELSREKELLQKELVECLLEQQQEQDDQQRNKISISKPSAPNNDDRKLDAIGESLVQVAAAMASATQTNKEDSKPPASAVSVAALPVAAPPALVALPKPDDTRAAFPSLLNSNDAVTANFLSSIMLSQQQKRPPPALEHNSSAAAVASVPFSNFSVATGQDFYSLFTAPAANSNGNNNPVTHSDLRGPFQPLEARPSPAGVAATAVIAPAPQPLFAPASLPRDIMGSVVAPSTINTAPSNFQLPEPSPSGRMDALLLLRSVLQNSAASATSVVNSDMSNNFMNNNPMFLPALPIPTATAATTSSASSFNINHIPSHRASDNQNTFVPQASSAMNLLLQQHQRHQQEQELLFSLLSGRGTTSDRA